MYFVETEEGDPILVLLSDGEDARKKIYETCNIFGNNPSGKVVLLGVYRRDVTDETLNELHGLRITPRETIHYFRSLMMDKMRDRTFYSNNLQLAKSLPCSKFTI